jgi:hypothetical protein
MPRILKDLKITEVSSVDRGAGRGVKVLLMKRDTPSTANPGDSEMTDQEIQAAIAKAATDAAATAVAAYADKAGVELAKANREIVLLKMSATHKAFYDQCDEPTKKAFEGMDDEKRDAHMKANPFKKRDETVTVDDLAKRDETVSKLLADNLDMKKRLDQADLEKAQADFKKRAADIGLTAEGDGELMRKAYAGDKASQAAFEKRQSEVTTALKKQAETGALFGEFGSARSTELGKAMGALEAKGEEIRKAQPTLTKEQAFTKAYTDPANAELVLQYKKESAPRLQ